MTGHITVQQVLAQNLFRHWRERPFAELRERIKARSKTPRRKVRKT